MSDNTSSVQRDPQAALQQQLLLHALAVAAGAYPHSAPPALQQYPTRLSPRQDGPAYPSSSAHPPLGSYPLWESNEQPPANPFMFDNPSQAQNAQAGSSSESGTSHSPQSATSPPTTAEEKRRRNTEASARFRVKKKHKSVQLQRAVDDLTGRADDLEREAAELRRENSWLKEIIMLKGRHISPEDMHTSVQPPKRLTSAIRSLAANSRPPSQVLQDREAADEEPDEQTHQPQPPNEKSDDVQR